MSNILINPATFGEKNELILDFQTNGVNEGANIDIGSLKYGGYLKWYVDDYEIKSKSDISYYPGTNNGFRVRCYKYTTSGPENIEKLDLNSLDISANLDVSALIGCKRYYLDNSKIENITFPNTDISINYITLYNNKLKNLDLSGLTRLGGALYLYNNELENINFPNTSTDNPLVNFRIYDNPDLSTLDLSNLINLGGALNVNSLESLQTIIFPDSSIEFSAFSMYYCPSVNRLDLSGLHGLGGNFSVWHNNANWDLSEVIFPESHNEFFNFQLPPANYYSYKNPSLNTLDLSGLHGLGGNIELRGYEEIIWPESSVNISKLDLYQSKFSGDVDLSGLHGLGGNFTLYSTTDISTIKFPDWINEDNLFTFFSVYGSGIGGVLDISALSNLSSPTTYINLTNNNFTDILWPETSHFINGLYINNNNLSGTIDLTSLSNLGGILNIGYNYDIEYLILPPDNSIHTISAYNCDISGNLDLSSCNKILNINVESNNRLNSITLKDISTYENSSINARYTGLSGELDIHNFNGLYNLNLYDCDVSTIIWPSDYQYTGSLSIYLERCRNFSTSNLDFSWANENLYNFSTSYNDVSVISNLSNKNIDNYYTFKIQYVHTLTNLDVSSMHSCRHYFLVFWNNNLTKIEHGDVSVFYNNINADYYVNNNNLTGVHEIKNLGMGLPDEFIISNNPNLTDISLGKYYGPVSGTNDTIRTFQADNCNLTGILDLSAIPTIGVPSTWNTTDLWTFKNNPNLENIIFGENSLGYVCDLLVYDCNLTGTFDVSTLCFKDIFWVYNNPNLENIIFSKDPSRHTTAIYRFDVSNTGLLGTLDISMMKLGYINSNYGSGEFKANDTSLNNILFPNLEGRYIHDLQLQNANLTDILDLRPLNRIGSTYNMINGSNIFINNNPNLTQILFDASESIDISRIYVNDCNLTGTLDVSCFSKFGKAYQYYQNTFKFENNPNLNNVLINNMESESGIVRIIGNNCDLSGTLDLSNVKWYATSGSYTSYIDLSNNPNLEYIKFNNTLTSTHGLYCSSCNLKSIDISSLSNITNDLNDYLNYDTSNYKLIDLSNNPELETIKFGENITYWYSSGYMDLSDCSISSDSLEDIFNDVYNSSALYFNIIAGGGNNNEPSGGYLIQDSSLIWNSNGYQSLKNKLGDNFKAVFNISDQELYFEMPLNSFTRGQSSGYIRVNTWNDTSALVDVYNDTPQLFENNTRPLSYTENTSFRIFQGTCTSINDLKDLTFYYYNFTADEIDFRSLTSIDSVNIGTAATFRCPNIIFPDSSMFKNININGMNWNIVSPSNYTLDVSNCNYLTNFTFYNTRGTYNNIIFPDNHQIPVETYYIADSSINSLDISNLMFDGSSFLRMSNNVNLKDITFHISDTSVFDLRIENCNIIQDVSGVSNYIINEGVIIIINNPLLSNAYVPKGRAKNISYYGCDLRSIDLTSITLSSDNLGNYSYLRLQNNFNLIDVSLPTFDSSLINQINIRDCSLSTSTIDNILLTLDNYTSSVTPYSTLSLYLDGGNSASPTDGSSNTNLQNLVSTYSSAGQTFNYFINT